MDILWQGEIQIAAPYDLVYRYLADFPKHTEWTQTIERMELIQPGDTGGVGAQYRTFERQGMQVNRRPGAPIPSGQEVVTLCEVRELWPSYRIAWRARSLQKPTMSAELSFDITGNDRGGTRLVQRIALHTSKPYDMLARLRNRTDPVILKAQLRAQWEAGLRNIKELIEAETLQRERGSELEPDTLDLRTREHAV